MKSALIIIYPQVFDNTPGMFQANKAVLTHTFIYETVNEDLGSGILYRFAWFDKFLPDY